MSESWRHLSPRDPARFRQAVYEGEIFLLPARDASLQLVADVNRALVEGLGPTDDVRRRQFDMEGDEMQRRLTAVRQRLAGERRFMERARKVLASIGLAPEEFVLDVPRLRAVLHRGHEIPAAAPAYDAHRDTWYANSEAQINLWIPLHDVHAAETFAFFPDFFTRATENSSADFDHDTWMVNVGWQRHDRPATAIYPAALSSLEAARRVAFACQQGEILVFSAAHLHQTLPNLSGATRFSVDFRVVHRDDKPAGRGAPTVDNDSRGPGLREEDAARVSEP